MALVVEKPLHLRYKQRINNKQLKNKIMNFEEFKTEVLKRAKKEGACCGEYKRALVATSYEELAEVIKDNICFNREHSIVTDDLAKECDKPEIWNSGKGNVGLFNIGHFNSGNSNSGISNSGDRNSGHFNSGNSNSGRSNSGDRNSGHRNSGNSNSGRSNSGNFNIGNFNIGNFNIGNFNSGNFNSGDRNSGYLNSGYRNSGVFCTRKRGDYVQFFNKDSKMTWDEWYDHPAYSLSFGLNIAVWIPLANMTDDEKNENPKALVCKGYVKVFTYHEAWANLWKTLDDDQKNSFKTLPNFDSDIFKEITGIEL
jgi:hypothetical protein